MYTIYMYHYKNNHNFNILEFYQLKHSPPEAKIVRVALDQTTIAVRWTSPVNMLSWL